MSETKKKSQQSIDLNRLRSQCAARARARVCKAHDDEYRQYLAEEYAKVGYDPRPRRTKAQIIEDLRAEIARLEGQA